MILAIAIGFSTFHVLRFEIDIVSIVYLGHHGQLDCILHISSGWKVCYIRLLEQDEQGGIQGFRIPSTIVSDGTFIYALKVCIKSVVDTNGWRVQRLQEIHGRPRLL